MYGVSVSNKPTLKKKDSWQLQNFVHWLVICDIKGLWLSILKWDNDIFVVKKSFYENFDSSSKGV